MLNLLSILLLSVEAISAPGLAGGARLHVERSFTIVLDAPPASTTRAFGPIEEQRWDPEFKPLFVYPSQPQAVEGAVFTLKRENVQAWLLQTFDLHECIVRYVAVDPGVKLTQITIRSVPWGDGKSKTTINYTWTSLTAAEDADVAKYGEHFVSQAPHWQSTLNHYLAGRTLH